MTGHHDEKGTKKIFSPVAAAMGLIDYIG